MWPQVVCTGCTYAKSTLSTRLSAVPEGPAPLSLSLPPRTDTSSGVPQKSDGDLTQGHSLLQLCLGSEDRELLRRQAEQRRRGQGKAWGDGETIGWLGKASWRRWPAGRLSCRGQWTWEKGQRPGGQLWGQKETEAGVQDLLLGQVQVWDQEEWRMLFRALAEQH